MCIPTTQKREKTNYGLAVITAKQVAELLLMNPGRCGLLQSGRDSNPKKNPSWPICCCTWSSRMVLDSYMVEYDPATFHNLMLAFGLGALVLLVGLGVAFLASFKVQKDARAILWFACAFSNAGVHGFPTYQGCCSAARACSTPAVLSLSLIF